MKSLNTSTLTLAMILAVLLLTGCGIPSVHPLYEPEDLVHHESLPGIWEDEEGNRLEVRRIGTLANALENGDSSHIDLDNSITEETIKWFHTMQMENLYLVKPVPENVENPEEKEEITYIMGLLRLGDHYFMDFYMNRSDENPFRFPVHIFRKVELEGDKMVMYEFDEEFLKELIKNRQIRIQHEMSFENFLLTAPPSELKKFVRKYADENEAYQNNTDIYTKVQ